MCFLKNKKKGGSLYSQLHVQNLSRTDVVRVGGSQEGKCVFWRISWASVRQVLLLIVALTQQTDGLIQWTSACVGLKGYKAYMLMELRISVGYCSDWQGQATGTVGYDEMRGAHSHFLWKEGHPWEVLVRGSPPAPQQDLCPLLCQCLWKNVGLSWGCKCLFFCSVQTSAGCV